VIILLCCKEEKNEVANTKNDEKNVDYI